MRANFSLKSLKDSTNRLYVPGRVVLGGKFRQLGWASCLVSAGRVNLAGGTTFSHLNTLARLPGTTYGVPRVTYLRNFSVLKDKFTLQKQNKLNKARTDQINERNSNEERYLEV